MTIENTKKAKRARTVFNRFMNPVQKILRSRYSEEKTRELISSFRESFKELLTDMPEVRSSDQLLERQLFLAITYLAIYKIMKLEDLGVEEIWDICEESQRKMLSSIPGFVNWIARKQLFSQKEKRREMGSALESQKKEYPDDFVFRYVDGVEGQFDYGLDMTECSMCKYFPKHQAEEFLPYICQTDHLFAQNFGYELVRTQTIAGGGDFCDFRFKQILGS